VFVQARNSKRSDPPLISVTSASGGDLGNQRMPAAVFVRSSLISESQVRAQPSAQNDETLARENVQLVPDRNEFAVDDDLEPLRVRTMLARINASTTPSCVI